MGFIGKIKEKLPNNAISQNKFQIFLFIGLFMVIFALMRIFHWDQQDFILFFGIGLIILLLAIDFSLKSKMTLINILGFLFACSAVSIYYFIEHRESDELAFLYSIGVVIIITNIFSTNFFRGFEREMDNLSENLKLDFRSSLNSESIGFSQKSAQNIKDMTELSIDLWRLEKKLIYLGKNISEDQQKSIENSIHRLKRFLKKYEFEIMDYTNKKYIEGLNVDVLSIERDLLIPESIIKETVEPAILYQGKIIKRAKVIVVEK